ncbi:MAG: hypothetical protein Q8M16_11485 [Pirellulaceae bacterium]|nr:hypothetical protein [Pirellulaceae bacterium]
MRLSDILSNGNGDDDFKKLWNETEAAGEMGPLPPGEYVAHVAGGELEASRTNATPGYKLTFRVVDGPLKGRQFWHDCWLTPAALPQTKRDLGKLGVTSLEQLEQPLPRFIRCKCKLALRRDDDGNERNRLKSFEVLGIDPPDVDPFAPAVAANKDPLPTLPGAAAIVPATAPSTNGGANGLPF